MKKIIQRKRDSSMIYDDFIKKKNIHLNTLTPIEPKEIDRDHDFRFSDLKDPLIISTLDEHPKEESLVNSMIVSPPNRPKTTKN